MDLSAPKLPPKPVREQAKVLYAYEAQNEDELTIREGDIINVLSKEIEDQGWFKGELNGKVGVFPDNFVELIRVPSSTTTTTPDSESQAMEQKGLPPRPGKPAAAVAAASSPPTTAPGHTTSPSVGPLIKSLSGKSAESSPVNGKDGGNSTKSSIFANLTKKSSSASSSKVTAGSSPAPSLAVTGKSSSFHKPDVLPVDPSHQTLDVTSSSTENGSGDGQPTSLTAIEVPAGSKLSHMTATRPKGPSNRRPPSYISVNNSNNSSGRESLTDGVTENGHNEGPTSANGKHSIPHSNNNNNMTSPSSSSNTTTPTSKPGNKEDPPWIIELRRTQEAKKQSSHHTLPSLTERQSSVDSTTGSTDSGPSSLVHTRPPLVKSQSVASGNHNNRASGDFSNRIGQFNGSSNSSTNSPHSNPTTTATAAPDSQPSSTSSPNPVSILKPMKPIKPVTSSGTGSLTKKEVPASPPTVSSSSPATSHVPPVATPSSTTMTTSPSSVTKSASDKVASPAAAAVNAPSIPSSASCGSSGGTASGGASVSTTGANSSSHSSSSSSSSPAIIPAAAPVAVVVPDPGTGLLIADLQRELQLLRETTVPVTQFHDLAKQVQELRDLMEQQKQSQNRIVKELIDDLAEERKKLAMLTIDVDRLRKLSAATV